MELYRMLNEAVHQERTTQFEACRLLWKEVNSDQKGA